MALVAKESGGGTFTPVPQGMHLARCYRIIDLGTQTTEYMGETKQQRKIMLGWELHGKDDEGNELATEQGDPMAIFKNYTLSWHEKATLRLDLQNWRGKPFTAEEMRRFDLENVISTGTNANVVTVGKDADLILDIVSEDSTRQILTYTATGQISAYRLNNRVVFRAFDNTGAEIIPESDIYVIRDLDFTTATVLASDIQQQQFLESMRADLALQILRRIATLGRVTR